MTTTTRRAHTIGSKYEVTRDLDVTAIAKLVRADIRALSKEGLIPAQAKYSVRISRYSMGQSISISASEVPFAIHRDPARRAALEAETGRTVGWMSSKAHLLDQRLEGILAAYNYDNSDSMTDYYDSKFYGSVSLSAAADATDSGEI